MINNSIVKLPSGRSLRYKTNIKENLMKSDKHSRKENRNVERK